jgi:hypothetical protein
MYLFLPRRSPAVDLARTSRVSWGPQSVRGRGISITVCRSVGSQEGSQEYFPMQLRALGIDICQIIFDPATLDRYMPSIQSSLAC